PIDVDVGQTHVGDSLVAPPVVVLLIDGEGHQGGVGPTVLGNGVGAGSLEVKLQTIEGVIVRVPPAPAGSSVVGNTRCTSVLDLACLLGPGRNPKITSLVSQHPCSNSLDLTLLLEPGTEPRSPGSNPPPLALFFTS
uniref:Uncharacterized protein n=1 Tax=Chelydra serpentina TaxID=8475 RepID=A0A8C3SPL7_CHESE